MRKKRQDEPARVVPAQRITTRLRWTDLVLPSPILRQLESICDEITQASSAISKSALGGHFNPGLCYLFRGASGTGKTLAATLIGGVTGRDVYRIDLSRVVSKYIGETEKNLATLFDNFPPHDWILLFDEADALFGKRTEIMDPSDRYANLATSYLLQRIEDYEGVVILTSNSSSGIDEAFLRRLRSVVDFPVPDAAARLRLWRAALPDAVEFAPDVNLDRLAASFEITGGEIAKAMQDACLRAVGRKARAILLTDIEAGISRGSRERHPPQN